MIQDAPSMNLALSLLSLFAIVSTALSLFFSDSFSSIRALLCLSISFSMNYSLALKALKFSLLLYLFALPGLFHLDSKFFLSLIISTLYSFLILAISRICLSFKSPWTSPKKSSITNATY
jgi:hypothetical protein